MELKKTIKGQRGNRDVDLWSGTDAEGRYHYELSTPSHGMHIEPSGCHPIYSLAEALRQAKEETR